MTKVLLFSILLLLGLMGSQWLPGTAGADYVNTTHAKLADRGSKLKPAPSGTTWIAGTDVEVAW